MQGSFWLIKNKIDLKQRLQYFERYLEKEWHWDKPVCWQLKPYVSQRSLSQNALFHVWCREMSAYLNEKGRETTESEIKMLLKYKFLGTQDVQIGKTTIPNQIRSTKKLDRGEMFHFMNQVQEYALDLGARLSHPQDSEYMKLQRG